MGDKATAASPPGTAVNARTDEPLDWHSIDWVRHEEHVRRLRRRIFAASKAGKQRKVRSLQKLMLRSWSNTLVSVRRVTQHSSGRQTAGLDGELVLTPEGRAELALDIHTMSEPWKASPVRRVYIPKANGKQRPLGIPTIRDRVLQARVKNALEPEWEAKFEPRSYGFRPGRSCHDAIEAIYATVSRKTAKRQWVLDADLSAAFDRIDHDHLLSQLEGFPARELIRQWLRAGVMEDGRFHATEEGTPQGGVVSPLLLNIALHGIETAAGVRYEKPLKTGPQAGLARASADSPVLVRYADDFVVFCFTEEEALAVKDRLAEWLAPRGLSINEEKTSVRHLNDGFDFLGFNVRRYANGTLLIKPSKDAVRRIKARLTEEVRALHGSNAKAVIIKLSPIVRGWSTYYRSGVSSETFKEVDQHLHELLWRWALRQHATKPRTWVKARYFGRFNKSRQDNWVFGDKRSGAYLMQLSWTPIVRHSGVKAGSSPDDPQLADYWDNRRRRKQAPTLDNSGLALWVKQKGTCSLCDLPLIAIDAEPQTVEEWTDWFARSRKALHKHHVRFQRHGGGDERTNLRLIHAHCHRQLHATQDE